MFEKLDSLWDDQMQYLEILRDSVRWRAYGQKNPLGEYKAEGNERFKLRLNYLRNILVFTFLHRIRVR